MPKADTRAVEIRAEVLTWTNCRLTLGELKRWERNPAVIGKPEAARLLESLDDFGQVQELAIDPDNRLVDGHQRLDTWIAKFGPEFVVDCRRASRNLTEKEREKLAVYLRSATVGRYNWDELANWSADDLTSWGMDQSTLNAWNSDAAALSAFIESNKPPVPEAPEAEMDRAEELREKWQTALGQLWIIPSKSGVGEHRLICGDCTDRAVVDRVMRGEKAVLTVTSPPYGVGKEYEEDVSFEQHLILLRSFADLAIGITTPGGFIFTNFDEIAAQSHAGPLTGSNRQCIYLISKDYWQIFHVERNCDLYAQRIWYKPFNRLQQPFWTYHTSIPHYQEWEHIWTWRIPGGNGDRVCDWDISVHAVWDTRDEATDDKPLTRHVAAFPVGIPERAIKAHSLNGEIVYEPFSGSGTVLMVSEQLARQCRAIEISPAYVAVSLERLAAGGLEPRRAEL